MITLASIATTLKHTGKYWIAFTGDSITSCEWVHPNWREIMIYVLHEETTKHLKGDWQLSEWGIRGFNFAYDGATTQVIIEKLDDLLLVHPQLTIGLMGGNDPAFHMTVNQHIQNLNVTADRLIQSGSEVVWCNSTPAGSSSPKNSEYEPYAVASMKLKPRPNLQLLDVFQLYQQYPLDRFFTFVSEENPVEGIRAGEPDLQHPNQLGNAYIAKIILMEVFGLEFDPEQYMQETLKGEKYPGY